MKFARLENSYRQREQYFFGSIDFCRLLIQIFARARFAFERLPSKIKRDRVSLSNQFSLRTQWFDGFRFNLNFIIIRVGHCLILLGSIINIDG